MKKQASSNSDWLLTRLFIQADKLNKVIKASGNTVESYWPALFAKALAGQDVKALLANVSAGPAAGAGAGPAAAAEVEKEKSEEPEPEEDVDMGGLFGGGDDEDY